MKVGIHYLVVLVIYICCCLSCNKSKFLDEKQNTDLFVPKTLEDFRLILDNDAIMSETPAFGEFSADNFYITNSLWQSLNIMDQRAYKWEAKIYNGEETVPDWNYPYKQVFYANVVLEGLKKLPVDDSNVKDWNFKKGWALFVRAYAFYNLSQVFAPVYDITTNNIPNSGIPLRLSPNINEPTQRSTVTETYNQIQEDLKEASILLPDIIPARNLNRPSKQAAFALFARVYLSMRDYDKAGLYADSCLRLYNTLIDYNSVSTTRNLPFDRYTAETLYHSRLFSLSSVFNGLLPNCIVDSTVYKSYGDNDLRRSIFFNTTVNPNNLPIPKGSYTGTLFFFSGLATDEMYLIRAECYARTERIAEAMDDLNKLLKNRYKTNTFTPYPTTLTREAALNIIFNERRKELLFRGVRWTDLRRLNKEGLNITLRRIINGETRSLPPNDLRYVLPIPPDVLRFTGIDDNKRE